jgi:uncharacterized protein DUF4153
VSIAPPARPPAKPQPPVPPLHGPWPATSPWWRAWPGAGRPAGPVTLLAVGVGAVVAALSLPLDEPGLGWLVTAVAGTAALTVARAVPDRRPAGLPAPLTSSKPAKAPSWDRYCWATATVALLAVGTFRSAGWLFLLCLAVATLTGALALAGGRSMRAIAAGYLMVPVAALRALPWVTRGLARMRRPAGGSPPVRIVATVAVSIALLVVFGALFASADDAFADVLGEVIPTIDAGTVARWIFVLAVATPLLGGAAYLRAAPADLSRLDHTEGRKVNRVEWAVPLGLLVLLFAGFVAVQITVLFGGEGHVRHTDGLTYADYARGGFWQLSFVTALTLLVLAGAARWAPRATTADRVLLRSILGPLAALTLVVVASALLRIHVYTDTYGLTRLRLLVACCAGWFALVLVMVLVAGVWIRAPWLPRAAIAAGVLALLGLAVANPDALIAGHNLRQNRTVDIDYLGNLSPDAAPAVAKYAHSQTRACVLNRIGEQMDAHDDWRQWNLGRNRARDVVNAAPACPWPPAALTSPPGR